MDWILLAWDTVQWRIFNNKSSELVSRPSVIAFVLPTAIQPLLTSVCGTRSTQVPILLADRYILCRDMCLKAVELHTLEFPPHNSFDVQLTKSIPAQPPTRDCPQQTAMHSVMPREFLID